MALEALEGSPVRRYSSNSLRSLIAMVVRRTRHRVNGSASLVLVKPFVVMAARVLGPGPTRLKLVKLAHNLSPNELVVDEHPTPSHPTRRAA
jgi:hypothetical protein